MAPGLGVPASAYAGRVDRSPQDSPPSGAAGNQPPGVRLGLPESGSGSIAPWGPRIAALLLDALLAGAVAWAFTAPELPRHWSLVSLFVIYSVSTALFGQTPGMALVRLRLAYTKPDARIPLWKAMLRTVMIIVVIPAVVTDRDRRGLHDRLCDTAVIRA